MGLFSDEIYTVATSYEGRHIPYGTGRGQIDCSHFVQAILEKATHREFDYIQANAYPNSGHFQQVDKPDRGDIVFWHETPHGHVGIVLDPHVGEFIGSQSTHGVGTDHYTSHYWRNHGGGPKFLRYVG
jgi:cell wall-associated NlpC family hydrolase